MLASPAGGNLDAVGSLQLTPSVQPNCTTHPKTLAVQFQLDSASRQRRVPLDFTGGDSSAMDGAWKLIDDVVDQLPPPSPSYHDVVLADFTDDQRVGAAARPLLSRRRRLDDEDPDVLQRLLPSSATDDRSAHGLSVTTSPVTLRRRGSRASERSLLGGDDVTGRRDDGRDVTGVDDVVDDVPWCKSSVDFSADERDGDGDDLTTRLETVL